MEPTDGLEPPTIWLQIRSSTNWAKGALFDYLIESAQTESLQDVESDTVVSWVKVSWLTVLVSFEQAVKVTNAAINNTFFIWYKYITFFLCTTGRGRTGTGKCPQDFKSGVSTYSTTVAFFINPILELQLGGILKMKHL